MKAIEKQVNLLTRKSMTKKAWKRLMSNDRQDSMPRPVVFNDKRFSEKYKERLYLET